jgi:hypothetical protein
MNVIVTSTATDLFTENINDTFSSFTNYFVGLPKKIIANVDEYIATDKKRIKIEKIYAKYFDESDITFNDEPNFPNALKRVWTEALNCGADYILHIESDWRLLDAVTIEDMLKEFPEHTQCAIRAYPRGIEKHPFVLSPSLIPASVVRACLEFLRPDHNPECSIRETSRFVNTVFYPRNHEMCFVQDLGRNKLMDSKFRRNAYIEEQFVSYAPLDKDTKRNLSGCDQSGFVDKQRSKK